MSFVDSVISTATEVFEKTARKSVYFAQIAKYNVKIAAENNTLKELYSKLGKAYYEGIQAEQSESAQFTRELCEKILAVRGNIEAMNGVIDRLKAEDRAASEAAAAKSAREGEAPQAEPVDSEIEITIEVKDTSEKAAEAAEAGEETQPEETQSEEVELEKPAEAEAKSQAYQTPFVNFYYDTSRDDTDK